MLKLNRHVLSKMQNGAILGPCFVTFSEQRQRNEQRRHAYTAIVFVAVAFEICLIKLPKTK